MARNKWDFAKCAALALPLAFLLAWLLRLPALVPAFALPERLYVVADRASLEAGSAPGGDSGLGGRLHALRGKAAKAYLALEDRLLPLPPPEAPDASYDALAELLPDRPSVAAVEADLERGLPPFERARIVSTSALPADSLGRLSSLARSAGIPLALAMAARGGFFPLSAFAWRLEAAGQGRRFELLFAPEAREATGIEVRAGSLSLWKGSGPGLPADLVLRLEATAAELAEGLRVSVAGREGQARILALDAGGGLEEKARVLVVTEKKGKPSFIESLYRTDRASPEEAARKGLAGYELVVIDGIPLSRIRGALLDSLLELNRNRSGSLLLAADSPDFGKKGDNPALEDLLPVSLLPRNLKELPDLAILILIDTSGSMFGDKLSLAKVTGLELLRSLKPTDRVGLMLFSEGRSWVYDFAVNRDIAAAPALEPVAATGGTDLATALSEGLRRLSALPIRERHVVVVSDGVTKPADFRALAAEARAAGVTVSTMGIGADLDRALLERLALETNGRFYRVPDADAIPGLLFEDRKNEARPPFVEAPTPILALNGDRVATVTGMAIHTPTERATVLYADKLGDPLFSSREFANRAVVLFASDLYGTYTRDFLSRPDVAGSIKDRLDALFAERPLGLAVVEGSLSIEVSLRSDALASPVLALDLPGGGSLEQPFTRAGPGAWSARVSPSRAARFQARIWDRGASLASFDLPANRGLSGLEASDTEAAAGWKALPFRRLEGGVLWLSLFFAASLAATVVLRIKR